MLVLHRCADAANRWVGQTDHGPSDGDVYEGLRCLHVRESAAQQTSGGDGISDAATEMRRLSIRHMSLGVKTLLLQICAAQVHFQADSRLVH